MEVKLLFDLSATQSSPEAKFHGGSEYAKVVFKYALETGNSNFDCFYNPQNFIENELLELCEQYKLRVYEIICTKQIEELIVKNGYTHFYSAMPYAFGNFAVPHCKFIMTIHGLRELECPNDDFEIKYRTGIISKLKYRIRKSFIKNRPWKLAYKKYNSLLSIENKKILTVSNHTKYSIINFFPNIKEQDIAVIHSPIKLLDTKNQDSPNTEFGKEYFLIISANRWIKNSYRAIKAFDELFSKNQLTEKSVVILGIGKNKSLKKVMNPDKFIFKDYVEEGELARYFRNAYCFVYPSLNEGFGYPPLNAMYHNIPIIASAISSIPEICGDSALYFNPFSIDEIKNRILQINLNNQLYLQLQNKGKIQLEKLMKVQGSALENICNQIFK
ncbi:glycosyltransferase [Sunxiuqinia sp. A32]|uniref:glycosyltransferase n=1 Tax=Sunxiuqinia sp. A32 TaxID=3461496 RepID=UPI004045ACA3